MKNINLHLEDVPFKDREFYKELAAKVSYEYAKLPLLRKAFRLGLPYDFIKNLTEIASAPEMGDALYDYVWDQVLHTDKEKLEHFTKNLPEAFRARFVDYSKKVGYRYSRMEQLYKGINAGLCDEVLSKMCLMPDSCEMMVARLNCF